jgi:hypothetical protein
MGESTVNPPVPLEEQLMIFGYLDPGSGSLILQAVIGGLTGLAVTVKALRSKYRLKRAGAEAATPDGEPAEDTSLPAEP